MDLKIRKESLIHWIENLEDEEMKAEIEKIRGPEKGISPESTILLNQILEMGSEDKKSVRVYTHEEIREELKEKYGL